MKIKSEKKKRVARRLTSFLLAGILVFSLTACGPSGSSSEDAEGGSADVAVAEDEGLFPIKTSTRFDCTLAPYLVAEKLGYFEEEGVKLEWTGEIPSGEYVSGVVSGVNDVADGHPNEIALQVQGGADIRAVGRSIIEPSEDKDPRLRHMRYFVTQEAADAGVATIADL
jgi:ABC-type nitrate/sulfonate/bicarbonate transport system substrate-binding protein